jgi:hypothetical protein
MEILIIAVLLGLVPAYIAQKKGRSFVGWWIYGALLFIVALPHAIIMDPLPDSEEAMKHDALVASVRTRHNLDHAQKPEKPQTLNRWQALTRYDPEIQAAVEELRPFGVLWVDKLGRDFFALNEDKSYLPKIIEKLKEEAQQAQQFDREPLSHPAAANPYDPHTPKGKAWAKGLADRAARDAGRTDHPESAKPELDSSELSTTKRVGEALQGRPRR